MSEFTHFDFSINFVKKKNDKKLIDSIVKICLFSRHEGYRNFETVDFPKIQH